MPDQPVGGDYVYDWVGNRLSPPVDPSQMVYNKANQLTDWPGMYSYTYWQDGSLKEVHNAQGVLTASYTYYPNGLLDTATYTGGSCVNIWDASGNRIGLQTSDGIYSFVYDPTAGVPAVVEETRPDETVVQYFRTPGGALIARLKGDPEESDSWRYYHYDELGSTRLLMNGDGDVTDTYSYDPYDSVTSHNGITADNPYQYGGAVGYYAHYQSRPPLPQ